ncbi:hypothetical protein [Pseudomonas sp. 28 E 9]|jgi:hypothetical protein|uniref:hypothetical protein n=1 Tax=Pseudomonas sp. 28 E 9 TaxID=1844098 RepID=UPI000812BD4D|nr:hypothetical protein [Pseudomonas sp. 28 E 9]CRM13998.1 hypothetical protein [Pseudomonas sp. 28 E 9]
MSVDPPPYVDYEEEWDASIKSQNAAALTHFKSKLDEMRARDKYRTQELIDGLYDDVLVKIDPDYVRPPSEEDSADMYDVAISIIRSWLTQLPN